MASSIFKSITFHSNSHSHFTRYPRNITKSNLVCHSPEPKLVITGGLTLSGHVSISGSKNSSLAILASTLCCSGTCKLNNVPDISDTQIMCSILISLGAKTEVYNGETVVNTDGVGSVEPCLDEMKKIRGGFFMMGPLLARFGEAVVGLPGGCDIGARPVDLYVDGFRALGAVVEIRNGKVQAYAANGRGLVGAGRFHLGYPSVGATETLMMAACLADGVTVLTNAAQEPEIIDLADFLNDSGASIEGAGTDKIIIQGKSHLHGSECTIRPDRMEAGTFVLAAAITRSHILVSPVIPSQLLLLMNKLRAAGCRVTQHSHDTLEISAVCANNEDNLQGFDVKTGPFPGFPTDLQPQTMALLTTCNGSSVIQETVFEKRMSHAHELCKLGARIEVCGSRALISGKNHGSCLRGHHVRATDLRGGMALVLAALAAEGTTEISGVAYVDRGYENLEAKLRGLGADVRKFDSFASMPALHPHCRNTS
ncbi:Enolpyruvate transferase domain [Dillenia turbinata]|uniref:UDP-N-acetylglucosamine 1-carboxyvinyltransferase n=1 Tax=Dillenia turbinata TaxID=194707 RepID=A0AAN8WBC3_9MAGN